MAKKGSVNRTEKVRQYMSEHPDESIAEVQSALSQRRIKVSRSLISQVRKKLGLTQTSGSTKRTTKKKTAKKKAARKKSASKAAMAPATGRKTQVITAEDLYEAKKLADELGGIERVREALDALERLK